MVFSYGYIQNKEFAGPETSLKVLNPSDSSKTVTVAAVVDSAAVMTCIPESQVQQLGNLNYSSIQIRDLNNTIAEKRTYIIDIELNNHRFSNVEVIAISKDYALIGRDILNKFKIILDAPNLQWSIEKPETS